MLCGDWSGRTLRVTSVCLPARFNDVVWWLKWAYSLCHVSLSFCHFNAVQWCCVVIKVGVLFVLRLSFSHVNAVQWCSEVTEMDVLFVSCLSFSHVNAVLCGDWSGRTLHVTTVCLPVTFSDAVWWLKWAYCSCHVSLSSCHVNAVQWCCVVTEMGVLFVSCQSVFLSRWDLLINCARYVRADWFFQSCGHCQFSTMG